MRWISCARRGPAGCGSPGSASMPVTARNPPSCGRWTTRTRCSSPTCIAPNGSGPSRRVCTFPPRRPGRGRPAKKQQASAAPVTVESLVSGFVREDWTRRILRDSTRGPLRVDIAHRRVWVWDGEEAAARCWHLIVRREVGSPKTIKYTLSNAPADTPLLRLAQMQGQRYWVERAFEDAKGECGLADYQALGWRAWHHHVTMVMLAMLFIAEQRAAHQPGLALLTPRDIVEMLKETLPRKPEGKTPSSPASTSATRAGAAPSNPASVTQRKEAPS